VPRKKTAAAVAGGKVIFGGGYSETEHASVDTWDMYDTATKSWSNGSLSSKRMRLQSVSLTAQDGTEYALFIGGLGEFMQTGGPETCPHTSAPSKEGTVCGYTTGGLCTTVDIYNGKTNEWSFSNLTRGRYEFAAAAVGYPKQDAVIISGGKQGGIGPQPWNMVEKFNVTTMEWSWVQAPYGWSYNAGTALPGSNAAIFAGGDFQNGTTTNFTTIVQASAVVTPPHPPTYFPDLKAPPELVVVSLLEDKRLAWSGHCTTKSTTSCAAELVLLGSIAGHAVRHEGPVGIFIEAVPDHRITLEMMRAAAIANTGIERLPVTAAYAVAPATPLGVAERVLKTLPMVKSYILAEPSDESLSAAKMQAWNTSSIIVDNRLEGWAQKLGLKMAMDVRGMTDERVLAEWAPTWPIRNIAVEQAPGPTMVDYTVGTGAMTWYNKNDLKSYNNSLRNGFLLQLQPGAAVVLGWGCDWTDETGCVSVSSSHGVLTEVSQSDYSLLTYGGYHHHSHFPFKQRARPGRTPPPAPAKPVHTVTFVLSDGDNVHWLHDGWLSEIWTAPLRGKLPLSIGFNPAERDLGQPLVEWLYTNSTANDSFVAMCPGGYAMMEWFEPAVVTQVAATLAGYMLDMDMAAFIGFADSTGPETWAPFLAHDEIEAAFHWIKEDGACYSADPRKYDNVKWVGPVGKPVVRGRISLWDPAPTDAEAKHPEFCGTPESVAAVLNKQKRNGNDPQGGFSMVPVRIHGSKPAGLVDIAKTISLLEKGGVEVVNAFEFLTRLQAAKPK
jgi:hypothetical protein